MRIRILLLLWIAALACSAVIHWITGIAQSEISHCSSGGGCHVFIRGTDLGSPFAPPTVVLGDAGQVSLECPGVPGSAFQINVDDSSTRRRSLAHSAWPRWPEDVGSSAISRELQLTTGSRYWLHLICKTSGAPCAVGVRILTSNAPRSPALAESVWRPPVRRGAPWDDRAASCSEITDKAECCAQIDQSGTYFNNERFSRACDTVTAACAVAQEMKAL